MTDTASVAPSDRDIDATWDALPGIHIHNAANARGLDTQTMLRRAFARAVLAKWGTPPAVADSVPVSQFDDPKVQAVYAILCSDVQPPEGEHWEGFTARRIVDAISADNALEGAAEALKAPA